MERDFRAQGIHPDGVFTGALSIEEAARAVELIQKDPESAVVAAFMGWKYVPTGAERAAWDIAEMTFNSQRGKGKIPIKLPRPWQPSKTNAPEMVSKDSPERLAALERLKANS